MNVKRLMLASVFASFLGWSQAPAQSYGTPQVVPQPITDNLTDGGAPKNPGYTPGGTGLSNWITYGRNCTCLGPEDGPPHVQTELFVRVGPSLPFGSGVFAQVLNVGVAAGGGGRALFFDHDMDRAWTIEISALNINNNAPVNNVRFPFKAFAPNAAGVGQQFNFGQGNLPGLTVSAWNRTFVNLGIGREYYLWAPACAPGNKLRVGWDGGGRYGTSKVDFFEIRHRTDVIGGAYFALHSDLEIPWGCCIFQAGVRGEYSYTWSDILQQVSDLQDFNIMLNVGVRF